MGLFDTVKLKANALAADAERAGKVTAAQARTVVLQNDIRKAERELGHGAFSLIESDEIAHPEIETAAARLREARQALNDKEAETQKARRREEAGGGQEGDVAEEEDRDGRTARPRAHRRGALGGTCALASDRLRATSPPRSLVARPGRLVA